MTRSERKRFVYINFMMKRINDASDEIYESLADSDEESAAAAIDEMVATCKELKESINGIQTKA